MRLALEAWLAHGAPGAATPATPPPARVPTIADAQREFAVAPAEPFDNERC